MEQASAWGTNLFRSAASSQNMLPRHVQKNQNPVTLGGRRAMHLNTNRCGRGDEETARRKDSRNRL